MERHCNYQSWSTDRITGKTHTPWLVMAMTLAVLEITYHVLLLWQCELCKLIKIHTFFMLITFTIEIMNLAAFVYFFVYNKNICQHEYWKSWPILMKFCDQDSLLPRTKWLNLVVVWKWFQCSHSIGLRSRSDFFFWICLCFYFSDPAMFDMSRMGIDYHDPTWVPLGLKLTLKDTGDVDILEMLDDVC